MFKKDYYVHLIEKNVPRERSSYEEYRAVVRASNALEAAKAAKEAASPNERGYYCADIRRI